jgi:hypothetical protein
MGEPQAVEACSTARVLQGAHHHQPADRHAEGLRADDAAFRLGAIAAHGYAARDVSLDSICYGGVAGRPAIRRLIEAKVRRGQLVPVDFEGAGTCQHWALPETLDLELETTPTRIHILSPFDPLVCQRKRLSLFFDYEHRFEAYLPAHRRVLGYFACPVLAGDRIVAALDLKADRVAGRLQVRKWTWMVKRPPRALRASIEEALHPFEAFQLNSN